MSPSPAAPVTQQVNLVSRTSVPPPTEVGYGWVAGDIVGVISAVVVPLGECRHRLASVLAMPNAAKEARIDVGRIVSIGGVRGWTKLRIECGTIYEQGNSCSGRKGCSGVMDATHKSNEVPGRALGDLWLGILSSLFILYLKLFVVL